MDIVALETVLRKLCDELAAQTAHNLVSESFVLVDSERKHYQVVEFGWEGVKRYYNVRVHLRIVAEKVYIERDMTEAGVAERLLRAGLRHEQIVLAFFPPRKRALTAFAVR